MRIAVVILSFLAAACTTTASRDGCQGAVNAEIAKFGITPDRIAQTVVSQQFDAGEDGRVIGHTFWMRLKSCGSGYLIVDTNSFCHIQQVYTTGDCRVAGVTHY
jgi:hypothetical protein